ncbi:trypsin, alkaline B-like [Spodoptera litura]|uniref:Trypsin, alkaline B-like n=1 Tax=Spodoptera litura TaxID=69820 RepID=A0A9J7E091_SPOLT|nr:trypsin, alkaline B-like [Spodoptera litura]
MMRVLIFLALCVAAVLGHPSGSLRVTGVHTDIEKYPSAASLQKFDTSMNLFRAACAGIILNNRAILTAAHCVHGDNVNQWRIFIASSYANPALSDRQVHAVSRIIVHPLYRSRTLDHNIAILHSATTFIFSSRASPASIAGPNYNVADNQTVWAVGWGQIENCTEPRSLATVNDRRFIPDFIQEVQQVIINQNTCRNNYATQNIAITDNMLCAGWHTNGHGHCDRDSGGPLYHNGVVVGIFTFSVGVAQANFPSVHTRVSRYIPWIEANA